MKITSVFSPLAVVLFVGTVLIWLPQRAEARIGERRDSLERRLLSSGGIVYRDETVEKNRRRGMPYTKYMDYMGDSAEVRIYFKTSDGRNPSSSELEEKRMGEGWDLHVVYVSGKSVLEVYKRSQAMSEHEKNHLLIRQGQGSFWKRLEKAERAELISAFGAELISDDGRIRASKMRGSGMLFVDADVDEKLAKMNESDLQKKAPVSVEGF